MADITVTLDSDRLAAIQEYATEKGISVTDVAQITADQQADILRNDRLNVWWNSLTTSQKQVIKTAQGA